MFQHLVVALDGSESSLKAFDAALDLAARANAQLDLVSVEEELPRYSSAREEAERERAAAQTYFSRIHADARRRAQNKRVTLHAEILAGHEAQTLMDFVRARRADLLVIGHKGHSGVWGAFLGSTASSLVTHAPCSVLVHRAKNEVGFKRLLVAHDGSPLSRHALQHALELAKLCGASLTALTVVEGASDDLRIPASIRQLHEAVVEQARAAGVELQVAARGGHAAQAIVDFARQGDFDLILAGATGQERPWSATAGGTAQRVAQEALCAVLLARPLRLAQRVQDVMAREVSTVAPQTPLPQVVELLIRRGVKAVPVVDEHARVVGIITGGDLLARGNLALRLSLLREPALDADALREQMRALAAGGTLRAAREVMTPDPETISVDADLQEAINRMAQHNIKRLPVVDADRRLVGIVTRADVLRAVAATPETSEAPTSFTPNARTVGEVMTRQVPTMPPDAPSEHVLRAVLESPLRRVVVVEADGRVRGIITDRNLLAQAADETRPSLIGALTSRLPHRAASEAAAKIAHGRTAADLMDATVFTARADDSLLRAIQTMMQYQVKRLVVVDAEGRLQGMVDRQQILRALTE
jgi:CBS domain-containing protein/nucleotide-binding universal stress UspA family protein